MQRVGAAMMAIAIAVAGCSSDTRGSFAPTRAASNLRGLAFIMIPETRLLTPEELQQDYYAHLPTPEERRLLDQTVARLGLLPTSYSFGSRAPEPAARYDFQTKSISAPEGAEAAVLVHELVHALDDQHFDLTSYTKGAKTLDESLARQAAIEGVASLCELRFRGESEARASEWPMFVRAGIANPWASAGAYVPSAQSPPFLAARGLFAYSFGASYAARRATSDEADWRTSELDAVYRRPPVSTEQIMRRALHDTEPDPTRPVGLAMVPATTSNLSIVGRDRLGAWMSYMILRAAGVAHAEATTLALGWDGDDLALLSSSPQVEGSQSVGIVVWTSVWDDEEIARRVESALRRVAGGELELDASGCIAQDLDTRCVHRDGDRVAFASGVYPREIPLLVRAALAPTLRGAPAPNEPALPILPRP